MDIRYQNEFFIIDTDRGRIFITSKITRWKSELLPDAEMGFKLEMLEPVILGEVD